MVAEKLDAIKVIDALIIANQDEVTKLEREIQSLRETKRMVLYQQVKRDMKDGVI
jgi:hypothetical protein